MQNKEAPIGVLEDKYAIQVILALRKTGPSGRVALYDKVANSRTTVGDRVDSLVLAGLIKETASHQRPFTKIIELTPKGRRVAELLAKVEEELRRT